MQGGRGVDAMAVLLRSNWAFSLIFLGEVVNQAGTWFNYVASLEIVHRLGGNSGLLVAGVIIARMMPSALLFLLAGSVADRFDRVPVLICSCLASCATAAALALVHSRGTLWLLYVLLFMLFGLNSFYDPARRALTTQLVPRDQLPLAATLDGFGWSVMAAVGSATGGIAVSHLGVRTCFLMDAATFAVAAACSALILWAGHAPPITDTEQ